MAWSDEPTDAQIDTVYRWLYWNFPTEEARKAALWLQEHSTRREVSIEMTRLKKLYDQRALNRDTAFESEIWQGYKGENE